MAFIGSIIKEYKGFFLIKNRVLAKVLQPESQLWLFNLWDPVQNEM